MLAEANACLAPHVAVAKAPSGLGGTSEEPGRGIAPEEDAVLRHVTLEASDILKLQPYEVGAFLAAYSLAFLLQVSSADSRTDISLQRSSEAHVNTNPP